MKNERLKTSNGLLKIFMVLCVHALLPVALASDDTDRLFNGLELQEIRLTMAPEDWQALRDNYLESTWYHADFRWGDQVITNVGVHSRGSGSRSGTKPSLKIGFDKYVRDQQLLGLKGIALKNNIQDRTQIKERLSMAIYREVGIPAPREVHARLYVNDEYRGLFTISEEVDKSFLQSHFGQNTGNLFSYKWAGNYYLGWKGSDPNLYIPTPFEPKTNESTLDPSGLVKLIDVINNEPDETFVSTISQYIDLNQFLAHIAVENAQANQDCIVGGWGLNNLFLYQSENSAFFTFIAWDTKLAFQYVGWDIFTNTDKVVLTQRLLNFPDLKNFYLGQMERMAGQWLNERWLMPRLEFVYNQIRDAALEDSYKRNSNDDFELAVEELRYFATHREADILEQVQAQR